VLQLIIMIVMIQNKSEIIQGFFNEIKLIINKMEYNVLHLLRLHSLFLHDGKAING
jgi:hypothetical protein